MISWRKFGKSLAEERKKLGLTQEEFFDVFQKCAEPETKFSFSTLRRIETGECTDLKSIMLYVECLSGGINPAMHVFSALTNAYEQGGFDYGKWSELTHKRSIEGLKQWREEHREEIEQRERDEQRLLRKITHQEIEKLEDKVDRLTVLVEQLATSKAADSFYFDEF